MNIFANIPQDLPEEISEILISNQDIKIERILTYGQKTPEHIWYDQDKNEWVLLLQGAAHLLFGNNELIKLQTGDYVNIPVHKKHRVIWTDPKNVTIWLAIFY